MTFLEQSVAIVPSPSLIQSKHRPSSGAHPARPTRAAHLLLPAVLVALLALRPACAYIDPNSAGPLYQLLFPLLVAIGSAIAMTRRYIARLWSRALEGLLSAFRRKPLVEDRERIP
jgi:hypothetical protein